MFYCISFCEYKKYPYICTMQNDKNNKEQFDNLVNNPAFIQSCIEVSKKLGVTAEQWNRDKGFYIGVLAMELLNNVNTGA